MCFESFELLNLVPICLFPALTVPQQLSLSPNLDTQQLSISWLGGTATTFDLMILRTELNETVFYVREFPFLFWSHAFPFAQFYKKLVTF